MPLCIDEIHSCAAKERARIALEFADAPAQVLGMPQVVMGCQKEVLALGGLVNPDRVPYGAHVLFRSIVADALIPGGKIAADSFGFIFGSIVRDYDLEIVIILSDQRLQCGTQVTRAVVHRQPDSDHAGPQVFLRLNAPGLRSGTLSHFQALTVAR